MKTSKWLKMMMSFVLICSLFIFAIPSHDGNAASSTKAKVVTKTYNKVLKYPQVSGLKSNISSKESKSNTL